MQALIAEIVRRCAAGEHVALCTIVATRGSTPQQTLREIAGGLGVSVERVRQIEERALGKLRDAAAWPQAQRAT